MIYTHSFDYTITSEHTEIPVLTVRLGTRVPGGSPIIPREQHTRLPWQPTSHHIYSGPEGHTDTNNKAGNRIYQGMSHKSKQRLLTSRDELNTSFREVEKATIQLELEGRNEYIVKFESIQEDQHYLVNRFDFYRRMRTALIASTVYQVDVVKVVEDLLLRLLLLKEQKWLLRWPV